MSDRYIPPGEKLDIRCPHCGDTHRTRYSTYDHSPEQKTDRFWCDTVVDRDEKGGVKYSDIGLTCVRRQLRAAEADAARYRFIRDKMARQTSGADPGIWMDGMYAGGPTFDAAIDSMMEQQKAAGGGG